MYVMKKHPKKYISATCWLKVGPVLISGVTVESRLETDGKMEKLIYQLQNRQFFKHPAYSKQRKAFHSRWKLHQVLHKDKPFKMTWEKELKRGV